MKTLKNKTNSENSDLKVVSEFIDNTKSGEYTRDFPEILNVTFSRTEVSNGLENPLPYIYNQPMLLFGLSY
jgi:hypothetical protein